MDRRATGNRRKSAGAAPAGGDGRSPHVPGNGSAVVETLQVPAGTIILVRLAVDVSSATAKAGDRFQGFPRPGPRGETAGLVGARGSRGYGVVAAARL